jgi:hypothetical protein
MSIALEAVGEDDELPAPDARPVEVEKIIVGRINTLPLIKSSIEPARQGRIYGLNASVAEEKRRLIGGSGN